MDISTFDKDLNEGKSTLRTLSVSNVFELKVEVVIPNYKNYNVFPPFIASNLYRFYTLFEVQKISSAI